MIAGIFMLAAMLVIAAVASLTGAVMLVPTDLGFAYLQASSILIGAGAIVMAVGFAARSLDRRLASLASFGRVLPAKTDDLLEPAGIDVAETPKATDEPAELSPAAGAATAAIAAAGATLAATSLLRDRDEVPAPDAAPIAAIAADLPESDPFNDILKDAAVVIPPSEATAVDPAGKPVELESATEGVKAVQEEPSAPEIELPAVDFPLPVDLEAIHAAVREAVDETVASADAPKNRDVGKDSAREASGDESATSEPVEEAPALPPASMPGLIPDADLAALTADVGPSLAPLATLAAVGSYDSGGTRFTMYSDGSVVAQGPEGERRFRSLEELRRHIGGA